MAIRPRVVFPTAGSSLRGSPSRPEVQFLRIADASAHAVKASATLPSLSLAPGRHLPPRELGKGGGHGGVGHAPEEQGRDRICDGLGSSPHNGGARAGERCLRVLRSSPACLLSSGRGGPSPPQRRRGAGRSSGRGGARGGWEWRAWHRAEARWCSWPGRVGPRSPPRQRQRRRAHGGRQGRARTGGAGAGGDAVADARSRSAAVARAAGAATGTGMGSGGILVFSLTIQIVKELFNGVNVPHTKSNIQDVLHTNSESAVFSTQNHVFRVCHRQISLLNTVISIK